MPAQIGSFFPVVKLKLESMAGTSTQWSSCPRGSDVLIEDPFLDYVNDILMDEGFDDASCLQEVNAISSYQAIFTSFQDLIAAPHPPAVSPDVDQYDAEYLQQVEGRPTYQAIFSSLQEIVGANSAATSDPQQAENCSASMHTRAAMKLLPENENLMLNLGSSFNFDVNDAVPQNDEGVVERNFGLKGDTDAQGHSGGRPGEQISHGTPLLPAPLADEQSSSDEATDELDLSFEEWKLEDDSPSPNLCAIQGLSSSPIASGYGRHKQKSAAGKGRSGKKQTSQASVFLDVREVLRSCAEAVARGNSERAHQILQEIQQVYGASAYGTAMQRLAYIFSRALTARMSGTGGQEYEAMSRNRPPFAAYLRAAKLDFQLLPFKKVFHYYAVKSIVQAAEGATRLHILDFGQMHGLQWPCLLYELANQKAVRRPPLLLVITSIESPQQGIDVAKKLEKNGQRLAAFAKTHNVPFEFHAIVSDKWEDVDVASLRLRSDQSEVLVVNCVKHFCHVADDTPTSDDNESNVAPRQKLLSFWRSLNPQLLVIATVNGAYNSPFFIPRFREALDYFTTTYDMLDTLWGDIPERLIRERGFYNPTIMNVVACEGAERVERPETCKQWSARIAKAGFEAMPIPSTILERSRAHVKQHYHKDFLIYDVEKGWILMCWKGRGLLALSVWKPAR